MSAKSGGRSGVKGLIQCKWESANTSSEQLLQKQAYQAMELQDIFATFAFHHLAERLDGVFLSTLPDRYDRAIILLLMTKQLAVKCFELVDDVRLQPILQQLESLARNAGEGSVVAQGRHLVS